jgi:hypothetical protein
MKKYIFLSLLGLGTVGLLLYASNNTYAFGFGEGGRDSMLERKAEILDMTVEELKEEASTKSFSQIAEGQGITLEQMHERMRIEATNRWREMGIDEQEIESRLERMEQKHREGCDGTMGGGKMGRLGGRGLGKNLGGN